MVIVGNGLAFAKFFWYIGGQNNVAVDIVYLKALRLDFVETYNAKTLYLFSTILGKFSNF